ncbi:MAG TPA: tetratricopeptide repeat protein, partial [Polyangia bacterium]|nr:tetratricopeptide repeat protein [Polyangia bacterium]
EAVARRAAAAQPGYVPARVALADILLDRGDWRAAERVLADGTGLDGTSDGLLVLARVALAKGDARGALAMAKRVLTGRKPELVEPDAGDPRPLLRARAVEKQARARRGTNGRVRP